MLQNTRLIYIPSLKKSLRLKELRNDHLFALFKTQDSIVDSISTQNDILQDCWVEEEFDIDKLTLVDVFCIFITWRIMCVDNEMIFDFGDTQESHELEDWLVIAEKIGSQNFKKKYNFEGFELVFDILSIKDDFELQREEMNFIPDDTQVIEFRKKLTTLCALKKINGQKLKTYQERKEIFNHLPKEAFGIVDSYQQFVDSKFNNTRLSIKIQNEPINFGIEVIPILIKYMFAGSSENMLQNIFYLSKKGNINYTDFMKMAPIETQDLIKYLQDQEKQSAEGDENEQIEGF